MFRSLSGFRAEYHDVTVLVVAEFNEWKVILHGPRTVINGTRQFSEAKAKEYAMAMARSYFQDRKQEELPELTWAPATSDDCLVWS